MAGVDDVVMGGQSSGNFTVNEEGKGVFSGKISLANNGGFSSIRYRRNKVNTQPFSKFLLRVKGDGKRYQFRVKTDAGGRHSYIAYFEAPGNWETIEIPFGQLVPSFRGNKLRMPNYPGTYAQEIGFLVANNKAENFTLTIDKIELR